MRTVPAEVMEPAVAGVSVKIIVPIPLDEAGATNRPLQLPADKIQNGMDVDLAAVFVGSCAGVQLTIPHAHGYEFVRSRGQSREIGL